MQLEMNVQVLSQILTDKVDTKNLENRLTELNKSIKEHPPKEKQIFLNFCINENIEKELKYSLIEQLEIALQILTNRGYKTFVFNSQSIDTESCKRFVEVFRDTSIQYMENTEVDLGVICKLRESEISIIMNEELLLYSLILEKPFLSLFANEQSLELLNLKNVFIDKDGFNAGKILEKVKYIEENYVEVKNNILEIFEKHKKEMSEDNNKSMNNNNYDIDYIKKHFSNDIHALLEQGVHDEIKEIIKKVEKITDNDVGLYLIKGITSLVEGNLEEAITIFKEGRLLYRKNFDLIYNLAYTHKLKLDYKSAKEYYIIALTLTKDEKMIEKIRQSLKEILKLHETSEDCEILIKNTETKLMPTISDDIYLNRKNTCRLLLDEDSPEVSIVVLAYNNLEKYTKICVESILKNTKDIDYELILVDNGSSDGTYEYFRSVPHNRKKIVKVTENKGASYGGIIGFEWMKGKYSVGVPNDVIVTKNWLTNMIKCAKSDKRIGFIVPVSDNISNYQSVDLKFNTIDELHAKAEKYNISDRRKWEERLRLINAVTFFKKECWDIVGKLDYGFHHDFSDDDLTFRVRRAGYKAILCKDVFVHHAGVTGSNQQEKMNMLEKGRGNFFQKYYGIDAWEDVNNFEFTMISLINHKEKCGNVKPEILGVDVRCGTPILELKNKLRYADVFDAKLSAFTTEAKYWLDLKTICEGDVIVDRIEYLHEHYTNSKFDYILIGNPLNFYKDPYKLLDNVLRLLKPDGNLLLKVRNNYDARSLLQMMGINISSDHDIKSYIDINILHKNLQEKAYIMKNIMPEYHQTDENTLNYIKKIIDTNTVVNKNDVFNKVMVKDYVIKIVSE
ncbi:glycosyltransferase [Heliorestis convoluta]|uniref:Glycosyl transferase 2 family protein n=1 Tax=Heliorestis convoluta TaxID=356322 RepID=A0A5Q2N6B4_9FIRM|nr:glycosyltransferase [Heliorestis convoluta]QGG48902.1 glycosyl transferase 2 family protein [Heliorestis convoluta]